MANDLNDPFEQENDGAQGPAGPPVVSWNGVRIGTTFTGLLVPPDPFTPEKGHIMGQSWTRPKDDSGEKPRPAFWPPEDHDNRRPVSLKEYKRLATQYGDTSEAQAVSRVELYVLTDLRDFTFMSEDAERRLKDAGTADNGLRRVLVDGADLREKVMDALREVGPKPIPASRISITLADREANKGREGKTNRFDVTVDAPTDADKKTVAEYVAAAKAAATSAAASKMEQEDPPF